MTKNLLALRQLYLTRTGTLKASVPKTSADLSRIAGYWPSWAKDVNRRGS